MNSNIPPPTPDETARIVAYIRAGGFPHVAAEAAEVPRAWYYHWLAQGQAARDGPCWNFCLAIAHAHAQARLRAEIFALKEKPMDWLKYGPGKETADSPGWSAAPRARARSSDEPASALEHPHLQSFFRALLDVLSAHPDADRDVRAAFSDTLPQQTE